jgi:hypothetical protein
MQWSKIKWPQKKYFFRRKKEHGEGILFFNDLPITQRKSDQFQFNQIADLIFTSLESGVWPMHVALLGSWGSGKTTVLKLLEEKLLAQPNRDQKFHIKFLSVWKFADDAPSLHRKIVRAIEKTLGQSNLEGISKETSEQDTIQGTGAATMIIKSNSTKRSMSFNFKSNLFLIPIFLLILIIPFFLYSYPSFQSLYKDELFVASVIICAWLLNRTSLQRSLQVSTKTLPLAHGDQYEERFEEAVKQYLKHNKGKRLILAFDDLDRLPPKQMLAALNTIKTFLNSPSCAFIIPCDEQVLRNGLLEAFKETNVSQRTDTDSISEFMNKTFDLIFRLPKIEKINMISYTRKIIQDSQIQWAKDTRLSLDKVLGILIYSGIDTPRQIKNILNSFAADWLLACKRDEEAGKTFLTKDPQAIAIFTVLKNNFPSFFSEVLHNPFNINEMMAKLESDQNQNQHQLLTAFLSRVKHSIPEDPRPFLYFSNEKLNPATGKPQLEKAKRALVDGQVNQFMAIFDQLSDYDRSLSLQAVLEDMDYLAGVEAENTLRVLIESKISLSYITETDLFKWDNLIRDNIPMLKEYPVKEVCEFLHQLAYHLETWKKYGSSLDRSKTAVELLDLWDVKPDFISKLSMNDLAEDIVDHLTKNNLSYTLAAKLFDLASDHPMVLSFDWMDIIQKCTETNDECSFTFCDWLKMFEQKTTKKLNCHTINHLLENFNFQNPDPLQGIGEFWCDIYLTDGTEDELIQLLELMENKEFTGFSSEDYKKISVFFKEDEHKDKVSKILDSWLKSDEEKGYALLSSWQNTPSVLSFCIENFSFSKEEKMLGLFTTIIAKHSSHLKNYDDLLVKFEQEINEAASRNRNSKAIQYIEQLINHQGWHKALEPYLQRMVPQHDMYIWLNWSELIVRDRSKLLILFARESDSLQEWLFRSLDVLVPVMRGGATPGRQHQGNANQYLNIIVENTLDKLTIKNPESLAERWDKLLYQNQNGSSIFEQLHTPIRNKAMLFFHQKCGIHNQIVNNWLFGYADLNNKLHQNAVIHRWEGMSQKGRVELSTRVSKLDDSLQNEFYTSLINFLITQPEVDYLDELTLWEMPDNVKQTLCNTLVNHLPIEYLQPWINRTLDWLNLNGLDKWRSEAMKIAIFNRDDLKLPDHFALDTALGLTDERSEIALSFLTRPGIRKREINPYHEKIMHLENVHPALVGQIKKKHRW